MNIDGNINANVKYKFTTHYLIIDERLINFIVHLTTERCMYLKYSIFYKFFFYFMRNAKQKRELFLSPFHASSL